MQRVIKAVLALVLFCARAHGQGTTLWDESINGPLSDGTSPPTPLGTLKAGTNSVIGTTDAEPTGSTWFVHYDFFAFDIPSNSVVSALYLQVDKANVWTWIGDPTLSSQLAFASNPSSGNLVVQWGLSQIDSGSYAMYMANHDLHQVTSTASYRLDFFVQAVPEPGAVSFIILGAGVVGCFRWKRFRWMKRISAFRRPTGQATN